MMTRRALACAVTWRNTKSALSGFDRIKYRLIGTKVVEATGFDITGHFLDELVPSDQGEPWMDHYRQAYEGRRPILGETTVPTSTGGTFTYEFGICPLRNGGREVRQFIAVEDYFDLQVPLLEPKPWQRAKECR